jgi:hypothetical protein
MFKKYLTLILIILIVNLSLCASAFAGTTKDERAAKLAEKVQASITKLGTGRDALVEVKLLDKTKLKGFVSQINENSFVVFDEKTGALSEVPYSRAKQVKGHNLSTGVKIAIGVAIVVAALVVIAYALGRSEP